ncbi:hypothetical protein L6252_01395 [Candidatus Parcubacteria bacterium]|nr:hypothetical protein [Candidatus Parcubacteria bacterium]
MAFNIFNPLNLFKGPKEQKYSAERGTQYSPTKGKSLDDSQKVAGGRYSSLVSKMAQREKKPVESQANVNKVESIFGNKGKYLKHDDLLRQVKKYDFKFQNIEHSGYYKSQEEARQGALNKLQKQLKGATYYQKNKVEQALNEMKKETTNPYLPGGQQARKVLKEQVDFLEKFYGLSSS